MAQQCSKMHMLPMMGCISCALCVTACTTAYTCSHSGRWWPAWGFFLLCKLKGAPDCNLSGDLRRAPHVQHTVASGSAPQHISTEAADCRLCGIAYQNRAGCIEPCDLWWPPLDWSSVRLSKLKAVPSQSWLMCAHFALLRNNCLQAQHRSAASAVIWASQHARLLVLANSHNDFALGPEKLQVANLGPQLQGYPPPHICMQPLLCCPQPCNPLWPSRAHQAHHSGFTCHAAASSQALHEHPDTG